MCKLMTTANKLATLSTVDVANLITIETKYGVDVKKASESIITALNASSALDVLMCQQVYNALNGIGTKSKNSKEEKANQKAWAEMIGVEVTKVSKMKNTYIDVIAQIPYTDILEKDTIEERNKYITSFKYNQLVELINCKYKFIAYAFKNYSDKLPNIKILDLRFIFANMKNGSEFAKLHEDVDIINDFEERINWILDGNKADKFGNEDTEDTATETEDTATEDASTEDASTENTATEDASTEIVAKFASMTIDNYLELLQNEKTENNMKDIFTKIAEAMKIYRSAE